MEDIMKKRAISPVPCRTYGSVSLAGCGGAGTTEKAAEAPGQRRVLAAEIGNSEKKEELVFV